MFVLFLALMLKFRLKRFKCSVITPSCVLIGSLSPPARSRLLDPSVEHGEQDVHPGVHRPPQEVRGVHPRRGVPPHQVLHRQRRGRRARQGLRMTWKLELGRAESRRGSEVRRRREEARLHLRVWMRKQKKKTCQICQIFTPPPPVFGLRLARVPKQTNLWMRRWMKQEVVKKFKKQELSVHFY